VSDTEEPSAKSVTAIHLDAVGGIAGDMFVAALLDAMPTAWPACQRAIAAMSPPAHVQASIAEYTDGVLTGRQFQVAGIDTHQDHAGHDHDHGSGHEHSHENDHGHSHAHNHHEHEPGDGAGHHPWRQIRQRIEAAGLSDGEREAAIGIFTRLAIAEAAVHGIAVDDVAFHEVGAWDSIVDIVAAAAIIAQFPDCAWSVGSLPRGRGLVKSAHGMLPLPAPATVELLKGYALHDDGEDGERITPTGAAILSHLAPSQSADPVPRQLLTTGTGFGTKRLKQRSNILRATLYGAAPASVATGADVVEILRCEIDDQTPEDLAIAIDKIRDSNGVLDVCQWPVYAKKGRIAIAIQVLVRQASGSDVARLMLDETTTLGVRRTIANRDTVERKIAISDRIHVKLASRPSDTTAKAEAADVSDIPTHAERQKVRGRAERSVLNPEHDDE
jgi:uncharacterized protein (TIGR00299 family) protein